MPGVLVVVIVVLALVMPEPVELMTGSFGDDGSVTIHFRYDLVPGLIRWTVVMASALAAAGVVGWSVGRAAPM